MEGDRNSWSARPETVTEAGSGSIGTQKLFCRQCPLQDYFPYIQIGSSQPPPHALQAPKVSIFPLINYHDIKSNAKIFIFKIREEKNMTYP